jgi:hypothetical protein
MSINEIGTTAIAHAKLIVNMKMTGLVVVIVIVSFSFIAILNVLLVASSFTMIFANVIEQN